MYISKNIGFHEKSIQIFYLHALSISSSFIYFLTVVKDVKFRNKKEIRIKNDFMEKSDEPRVLLEEQEEVHKIY